MKNKKNLHFQEPLSFLYYHYNIKEEKVNTPLTYIRLELRGDRALVDYKVRVNELNKFIAHKAGKFTIFKTNCIVYATIGGSIFEPHKNAIVVFKNFAHICFVKKTLFILFSDNIHNLFLLSFCNYNIL